MQFGFDRTRFEYQCYLLVNSVTDLSVLNLASLIMRLNIRAIQGIKMKINNSFGIC